MKQIIIEDVKSGISGGGIGCGPMDAHVVAEVKLNEEGEISYYGLVEVDGIPNFYKDTRSRYEEEINEDFDEDDEFPAAEGFFDYGELYEAMEEEEDRNHAFLLKLLVCLVRLDGDEEAKLKEESIGKLLGSFELPICDAEEEYNDGKEWED